MRNKISGGRGRPHGRQRSYVDSRLLEYLAEVSMKYGIDSSEFFDKIVAAWKNQKSECKRLTIECREKAKGHAIFLITSNYKAVAQFPVPERILKETGPLKEFKYVTERSRPASVKEGEEPNVNNLRIKDLKVGMKRVNLEARVLKISEPRLVITRFNEYAMLANAVLMDETGTVKLTLWNEQIGAISVGDVLRIENANVATFKGELQLRIGRHGKLSVIQNDDFSSTREVEKAQAK